MGVEFYNIGPFSFQLQIYFQTENKLCVVFWNNQRHEIIKQVAIILLMLQIGERILDKQEDCQSLGWSASWNDVGGTELKKKRD